MVEQEKSERKPKSKRMPPGLWQKGQSGNPKGRSLEDPEYRRIAKEHSVEAMLKAVEWMREGDAKHSLRAIEIILDRAFGKPKQAHEVSGTVQSATVRDLMREHGDKTMDELEALHRQNLGLMLLRARDLRDGVVN